MMLRKVSTMSEYANIYCLAFESTEGGTQFYKSGRWVLGLLSEFCAVQVLLGLGHLSALLNIGVSAFQGV